MFVATRPRVRRRSHILKPRAAEDSLLLACAEARHDPAGDDRLADVRVWKRELPLSAEVALVAGAASRPQYSSGMNVWLSIGGRT